MAKAPNPRRGLATRWINAALVAMTAAAMLLVVLLVIRTVDAERAQRQQAQRTTAILDELRDVSRAFLNAETGQRGYLLSLDRRYLAPFFTGRDQIDPSLRKLRELLTPQATDRQLALLDQVEGLSRVKFAELERGVALVGKGDLIEARRLILTDRGQEAMEGLRRAMGELERIELAVLAEAVRETERAEGRVMPLLGGLLALLAISLLAAGMLIASSARAEAVAAQAGALAAARDRADLLARELNHRVKNLFAVVLAIVKLSARDAPHAKTVTEAIAQRIQALLKAHEVSQGELDHPRVSLSSLVETTLAPYRSHELTASVGGPEIVLHARSITPVGLLLHELVTNAVKYGGWSQPGGTIAVDWARDGEEIVLNWRESGVSIASQPTREGFGSMLMTSSARQLGGTVERRFEPGGAAITLRFPADD